MENSEARIMSKAEIEEMEENRMTMRKIKRWFAFTVTLEIICMVYISSVSGGLISLILTVPIFIYLFLINKRDVKICTAGVIMHFIIAAAMICSAVLSSSEVLKLDPSAGMAAVNEVSDVMLPVPLNEGADLGPLISFLKIMSVITLVCTIPVTGIPVFMNFRAMMYCRIEEELSVKRGYPNFMTNYEFIRSFTASEDRRIRQQYAESYPESEFAASVAYGQNAPVLQTVSEETAETEYRSIIDKAVNNEGTDYLRSVFKNYKEQITKSPENIYDYTILTSFALIAVCAMRVHAVAPAVAGFEIFLMLFAMLPRKVSLMIVAFAVHAVELVGVFGTGLPSDSGALRIAAYMLFGLICVIQTVMCLLSFKFLKREKDEEFEFLRQSRKDDRYAETQRKIKENEENMRETYYNRKPDPAGGSFETIGDHFEKPAAEKVPAEEYSDWSKVDNDLAASMLSDIGE